MPSHSSLEQEPSMAPKIRDLEQRWRYEKRNGQPIWLGYDPLFLCVYCDRPVGHLSFGGPAICPSCDSGYSDGKRWDHGTFAQLSQNALRRLDEMPYEESWNLYEAAFKAQRS